MTTHVYRYWNAGTNDHFYTQNAGEIGTTQHGQSGNHGYSCEGEAFHVYDHAHHGLVPVYRYWHAGTHDHFYTTNAGEIGTTTAGATGNHGYTFENIIGYVSPHHVPGSTPIYRYWKASVHDHFYTTNASEIGATNPGQAGNHGYVCEGVLGYALPHVEPVHRYYHEGSKDHFYTQNAAEIGTTQHGHTGNHGYKSEGVAFHVSPTALHGLVAVYRYYQPSTHDHFYTTNGAEIGVTQHGQAGNHGYSCEGVIGHISPSAGPGLVAVYRYWQPTAHDHFYTTNASEIGATNQGQAGNHGYVCEGVLGYAFP